MRKNPPEFYGVDYLKSPLAGGPGLTRWEDNGVYFEMARFIHALAPGASVLEVGCGRGFVVRHLRNMGHIADGCEYGTEAVAQSVCGAQWADLTAKLPYEYGSYDLVLCVGVLSHPPALYAQHCLDELARVSRRLLVTNIQVEPHELQRHHLNIKPAEWWRPRFAKAGWRERTDAEVEALIERWKYRREPLAWFAVWEQAS